MKPLLAFQSKFNFFDIAIIKLSMSRVGETVHPSDLHFFYDPRIDVFGVSYKPEDIVTIPTLEVLKAPQKIILPLEQEFPKNDPFIQSVFTETNIQAIQNGIIGQVKKRGYKIGPQSLEDVMSLMKGAVLEGYVYTDMRSFQAELLRIDTIVVALAVPGIIANIGLHLRNYYSFDKNPVNELPLPEPSVTHNGSGSELPGYINKFW